MPAVMPFDRSALARHLVHETQLLQQLDALYGEYLQAGPAPILAAWAARCDLIGREIEVDEGGSGRVRGTANGIDRDGALLLRVAEGATERILAGDVKVIKA